MADKEKGGGDPSTGPLGTSNPWEFVLIAGILSLLLTFIVVQIFVFLRSINAQARVETFFAWIRALLPYARIFGILFSLVLLYVTFSVWRKLSKLKHEIEARYAPPEKTPAEMHAPVLSANPAQKKWERIQKHMVSDKENDWKIAIIEADAILEEMMDKMGYHGENLGAKLKAVEPSDFTTIDNAWEAHKVRNEIAHGGAEFRLSEREARRIIALYESVFREFKYI